MILGVFFVVFGFFNQCLCVRAVFLKDSKGNPLLDEKGKQKYIIKPSRQNEIAAIIILAGGVIFISGTTIFIYSGAKNMLFGKT